MNGVQWEELLSSLGASTSSDADVSGGSPSSSAGPLYDISNEEIHPAEGPRDEAGCTASLGGVSDADVSASTSAADRRLPQVDHEGARLPDAAADIAGNT